MMHFRKKALVKTKEEYHQLLMHTRAGDGMPSTVPDPPFLILEANMPYSVCHAEGTSDEKAYIIITGEDIAELFHLDTGR